MTIRDHIRTWLGITEVRDEIKALQADIATVAADIPSLTMFKAMEQKQAERHTALMEVINRIEQRMINTHVGEAHVFAPAVLDWDTVLAIAMHDLSNSEPPKEMQSV